MGKKTLRRSGRRGKQRGGGCGCGAAAAQNGDVLSDAAAVLKKYVGGYVWSKAVSSRNKSRKTRKGAATKRTTSMRKRSK